MNRKSIRSEAFKSFKKSYFKNIIVAFLVVFIIDGGYLYSTKTIIQDNNINVDEGFYELRSSGYAFENFTEDAIDSLSNYSISKTLGSIGKNNIIENTEEENVSNSKLSNSRAAADLFFNIFSRNDKITAFREKVRQSQESYLTQYNEGIISTAINDITSTSISFGIVNTINVFMEEHNVKAFVLSIIFTSISVIIFFLLKDVVDVGKNRYYLEQRRYYETKVDKILFPYKVKRTRHVAWILFCKYCFQFFWNLTIIGGFIKLYEYKYIPYVIAENPNISRKDAFKISKEMTNGNKWNLFLLDLSLFWYHILGTLTLNLSNLFFYNGYKECVGAEAYMQIRDAKIQEWKEIIKGVIDGNKEEIANNIEYYKHMISLLNDDYLAVSVAVEEEYPEEHYVIPQKEHVQWLKVDYKKDYSIVNLILFFFVFSLIGYLWEVFLYLVRDGVLVNRGAFYGPWLPIYGSGGVAILVLLKKFRDKPIVLFFMTMLLCGVIEYVGGWYLETIKGMKYWDYSTYFFNIQGRVCLECSLVFGLGGCGFMYILAPICDNLLNKIALKHRIIMAAVLVGIFAGDFIYSQFHPHSGEGITSKVNKEAVSIDGKLKVKSNWSKYKSIGNEISGFCNKI